MLRRRAKAGVLVTGLIAVMVLMVTINPIRIAEGEGHQLLAANTSIGQFQLHFDSVRPKGPRLNMQSALLANYKTGEVIFAKEPEEVRPIASISKLVAAMVVLDSKIDLNTQETITKEDSRRSSRSMLRPGWQLSLNDLLYISLMKSDNRATRALARAVSGSIPKFVELMNEKARALGLSHTEFFEPTGLDERNVSTAHEVAIMMHAAYEYDTIARITSRREYRARVLNRKRTVIDINNTNRMVYNKGYQVLAGKTGYINESAYCLVTLLKNREGETLTLVVLGAPAGTRFKQARTLATWGFSQI